MLGNRGQEVSLSGTVAEILTEVPQLFRQFPVLVALSPVDLLLGGILPVPQELGHQDGGVHPGDQRTAGAERRASLGNAKSLLAEPQGIILPADGHAFASLAKLPPHEGSGGGPGGALLEKRYDALNAVLAVAAAGQGPPNDRLRHLFGGNGHLPLGLPLLRLDLDNAFHLFFHRGEQMELGEVRAFRLRFHIVRRRGNGGLSARRLFSRLVYL